MFKLKSIQPDDDRIEENVVTAKNAGEAPDPETHRHTARTSWGLSSACPAEDDGRLGPFTVSRESHSDITCQALAGAENAAHNSSTSLEYLELGGNPVQLVQICKK